MSGPVTPTRVGILRALANPDRLAPEVLPIGAVRRDDATGFPSVLAGPHAVVARATSDRRVALKCHLAPDPDRARRIRAVGAFAADLDGVAAPIGHHPQALALDRGSVDVTVMPWVEGTDLLAWVRAHAEDGRRLGSVARSFAAVVGQLATVGLAHGDLQHGSILVTPSDEVVLVALDGMYVSTLSDRGPARRPHPHYAAPGEPSWSSAIDRHAAWTIYASLVALTHDPDLLLRVPHGGVGRLVLSRHDHEDLADGPAVQVMAVSGVREVRTIAARLGSLARSHGSLPAFDPDDLPPPSDRPWWVDAAAGTADRRRKVLATHDEVVHRVSAALDQRLAGVRARRRDLRRAAGGAGGRRPRRDLTRHRIAAELATRLDRRTIDELLAAGVATAADVTWSADLDAGPLTVRGGGGARPVRLGAAERRIIALWRDALAPAERDVDDVPTTASALVVATNEETDAMAAARAELRGAQAVTSMALGALQPAIDPFADDPMG